MTENVSNLSVEEAYLAMYEFLIEIFRRTQADVLGSLLGDLSLLQDGTTADPAAWRDWIRCVEKAQRGEVRTNLLLR